MTELEQKVLEAKDYFYKTNNKAFEACRAYEHIQAKINELREELLGLCGVMKRQNVKPYGHLTGLIMLKQRMHNAYRDMRIASLRILKECCELLAETNRAYKDYMSLKKQLRKAKEDESCERE